MATRLKASGSHSGLFLLELIAAIGLFALASAVCVQLFAHARLISDESRALSQGTLAAQSAAECFKAAGGDLSATAALLPGAALTPEGVLYVRFDAEWQPLMPGQESDERPALFQLNLRPSEEGTLAVADIELLRVDDKERRSGSDPLVYQLQVKALQP